MKTIEREMWKVDRARGESGVHRRVREFSRYMDSLVRLPDEQFELALELLPNFRDPLITSTVRTAVKEVRFAFERSTNNGTIYDIPNLTQTIEMVNRRREYYKKRGQAQALYGYLAGDEINDVFGD